MMRSSHPIDFTARSGEEGIALMLVLVFVLLLGALVVEYSYETQVEASLTANTRADLEAYIAAKSAVASGLGLLQADLYQDQITQGVNDARDRINNAIPRRTQPKPGDTKGNLNQTGQASYDGLTDIWAEGVPYQPINNAVMQCIIDDESGKLNLNALITGDGQVNEALVAVLAELFKTMGVEEDPTDSILDWVDPDDDSRPNGAESDYYSGLETPYLAKNGPMDSIDELLLIRGITPEMFFDCNRSPDDQESTITQEGERLPALRDLLTVHGHPQGKININTARRPLLEAIFAATGQGDPAGLAEAVIARQLENPFPDLQELQSMGVVSQGTGAPGTGTGPKGTGNTGIGPKAGTTGKGDSKGQGKNPDDGSSVPPPGQPPTPDGIFDVKSSVFRICGNGKADDVMVRIEAYVFRLTTDAMNGMPPPTRDNVPRTNPEDKEDMKDSGGSKSPFGPSPLKNGAQPLEAFRILDWRVIR